MVDVCCTVKLINLLGLVELYFVSSQKCVFQLCMTVVYVTTCIVILIIPIDHKCILCKYFQMHGKPGIDVYLEFINTAPHKSTAITFNTESEVLFSSALQED